MDRLLDIASKQDDSPEIEITGDPAQVIWNRGAVKASDNKLTNVASNIRGHRCGLWSAWFACLGRRPRTGSTAEARPAREHHTSWGRYVRPQPSRLVSGEQHHGAAHYNARVRVDSSAPTRLDLAGGTLDIWPLYLFHEGAVTVNAATTLRASCTLSESEDDAWHLRSIDTGTALTITDLSTAAPREHRLAVQLLRFFAPSPLVLVTHSESPLGAGLAGSSALAVAVSAALARWVDIQYEPERFMDIVMNLEAQVLGVPTGTQDYRPAVYGGVSAIDMGPGGVVRRQLAVDVEELSRRALVIYTGESRNSGLNNWEVTKLRLDGDARVTSIFGEITAVAQAMVQAVETAAWRDVERLLSQEWELRKQLAPGVTTPRIDALVACGDEAGARAAKICGAGGGGCLLFLADPPDIPALRMALTAAGGRALETDIDREGLRVTVTQ